MAQSQSYTQSYDYTTGQDMAHKVGQERSQLESATPGMLYGGKIEDLFSSGNRIRALRKYLEAYGADPSSIEVIPKVRLERDQLSSQSTLADPPQRRGE